MVGFFSVEAGPSGSSEPLSLIHIYQVDEDFGKEAYRLSAIRQPPFYGCWFGGSDVYKRQERSLPQKPTLRVAPN